MKIIYKICAFIIFTQAVVAQAEQKTLIAQSQGWVLLNSTTAECRSELGSINDAGEGFSTIKVVLRPAFSSRHVEFSFEDQVNDLWPGFDFCIDYKNSKLPQRVVTQSSLYTERSGKPGQKDCVVNTVEEMTLKFPRHFPLKSVLREKAADQSGCRP